MKVTFGQRVSPDKLAIARKLRREMTPSERVLWQALRRNSLGRHFRRQQIVGGFIVDFYCAASRLAVEIDGAAHLATRSDDRSRDSALRNLGIQTLRISSRAVAEDLDAVLLRIAAVLKDGREASQT